MTYETGQRTKVNTKSRPIAECRPGDRFLLTYTAWGRRYVQRGTLVRIGVGSVTVLIDGTGKHFEFTPERGENKGKAAKFNGSPQPVRWAPDVPVLVFGSVPLNDYWQAMNDGNDRDDKEPNMAATAVSDNVRKAFEARMKFATKKFEEALESGDDEAIIAGQQKIDALTAEAKAKGVNLNGQQPEPEEEPEPEEVAEASTKPSNSKGQKLATANAQRKQTLAAAKANKTAPAAKEKPAKKQRLCLDGCGTYVNGNFAMGHDAKLKSLIHKIERGEATRNEIPEIAGELVKFKNGELLIEKDGNNKVISKTQTLICTASPVRIPGREDVVLTKRDD